jgi:hypothetical protein
MHFEDKDASRTEFAKALVCHEKVLIIRNKLKSVRLSFPIASVTKLGLQIMSLGEFKADVNYLQALGVHLVSQGYEVGLGDVVSKNDSMIHWSNESKIIPK